MSKLDQRSHGSTTAASALLRKRDGRAGASPFSYAADGARPGSSRRPRNDRGGTSDHRRQDGFAALQHRLAAKAPLSAMEVGRLQ